MNRLIFVIVPIALLAGCTARQKPVKHISESMPADTAGAVFTDKAQSGIQVFKDADGWKYRSVAVNYKIQSFVGNPFGKLFSDVALVHDLEYFIVKYTTQTRAMQGSETEDKTITAEIRPLKAPDHNPLIISQNCGDLTLAQDHYKTVRYGCCGGDDEIIYFDYQRNIIIEGDSKIIQATVPNSDTRFYVGFKPEYQDSTLIGTLYFSYDGANKYKIRIRSNAVLPSKCDYHTPEMSIITKDKRDNFVAEDNEYLLWSLEKIKSKEEINLVIKVVFECTSFIKHDSIEIPIIRGKPFGTDERTRDYTSEKKGRIGN